jgi:hypothetical protein
MLERSVRYACQYEPSGGVLREEERRGYRLKTPAPPMRIRERVMGSATRRGWLSFEVRDEAQEHPTHVQPVHRCISQMLVVREGSGGLTTGERGVGSGGVKCEQHETVGTVETSWLGRRIRTLLVVYPERVRRLGEGHGVRRLKISARDRQFRNLRSSETRLTRKGPTRLGSSLRGYQ